MLNQLDAKKIAFRFNKAAHTYDEVAFVQRAAGSALLERLQGIKLQPQAILDLGCSTGHFEPLLMAAYPSAEIVGFDQAENMLKQAKFKKKIERASRVHWLAGRAESLPFSESRFELIYSNLMLHWSTDFQVVLNELSRILKPGGLLLFSIVGVDTLKELRYCWSQVDDNPHVHAFPDMHDVGDILLRAAFADPVMDVEYFTLLYSDTFALMKDLKGLGVQNLSVDRHRGLTSKKSLRALVQAYEALRHASGKLPATWEIIYGHAWAPLKKIARDRSSANEIKVAVDSIGGLRNSRRRHSLLS